MKYHLDIYRWEAHHTGISLSNGVKYTSVVKNGDGESRPQKKRGCVGERTKPTELGSVKRSHAFRGFESRRLRQHSDQHGVGADLLSALPRVRVPLIAPSKIIYIKIHDVTHKTILLNT